MVADQESDSLSARFGHLTLGTAQLGERYGIANRGEAVSDEGAFAVLDAAWSAGVRGVDAARAYGAGRVERRIGAWMESRGTRPAIVTKIAKLDGHEPAAVTVRRSLRESAKALGIDRIDGVLTHGPDDIRNAEVSECLEEAVSDGLIGAFGASVYRPEEADAALRVPGISMIQLPVSVFDGRAESSGVTDRCMDAGVAVFARSIFLQGLLFLDPDRLPASLVDAAGPLRDLADMARSCGRAIGELAVVFVRDTPGVTSMVVGAETREQIDEIARFAASPSLTDSQRADLTAIGQSLPERIIHPGMWETGSS